MEISAVVKTSLWQASGTQIKSIYALEYNIQERKKKHVKDK
jgi:hypothetical protein